MGFELLTDLTTSDIGAIIHNFLRDKVMVQYKAVAQTS
jgi:hypothetical protein